jgi:diguanylate cyclase (GGDEF)-like protein
MRSFLSALVVGGILAAGIALAAVLQAKEERRVRDDDRDRANRAAFVLQQTVAATGLSLRGAAGLFEASSAVSRREFETYVAPLFERQPALNSVLWMPRVSRAGRRAYERRTGRSITEGPLGSRRVAPSRPVHFPVTYRFSSSRRHTYGWDGASDAARSSAIRTATRRARPHATPAIPLANSGAQGVLVYQPVFRSVAIPAGGRARERALRGVVAGTFRIDRLAATIRSGLPAGTILQVRHGGALVSGPARLDRAAHVRVTAAGRRWTLRVASTRTANRAPARLALGAGILLALMALLLLRQAAGRERYAQTVARRMAAEQVALRRVATHIASAGDLTELFELVARELAGVAGAAEAAVVRHVDGAPVVLGSSGRGRTDAVCDWLDSGDPGVVTAEVRFGAGASAWGAVAVRDARDDAVRDLDQHVRHFADLVGVAVANDEARRELSVRAATDALTGLANRRTFDERLDQEVSRARRHDRPLALAIFDIDHFKRTNDRLGHAAGDAVLARIARTLQDAARRGDVVARLGGEEFGWLMPETDLDAAVVAADRARQAIAGTDHPGVGRQTISAGVHALEANTAGAASLYAAADAALYEAKRAGRDRVAPGILVRRAVTARA